MKTPTPSHVKSYKRNGKWYHYFRHAMLPHAIRLPSDHTSADFVDAYAQCLKAVEQEKTALQPPLVKSLKHLISLYRASPDFKEKSERTQKDYEIHLKFLEDNFADRPVATMPRAFVIGLRDKLSATPRRANYVVQVISILMSFCVDLGWRTDHPALRIKKLRMGDGYKPWELLDIQKVRRVAYDELNSVIAAALFTGLRQGDVVRLTWADIRGNVIRVKPNKTKHSTGIELFIPIHPLFRKILDTIPRTSVVIFTTRQGRPWGQRWLKEEITRVVRQAGLSGLSYHGLRKTACGALADAGCTREEIKSITGQSDAMISYYIERTKRKRRAQAAIAKLPGSRR